MSRADSSIASISFIFGVREDFSNLQWLHTKCHSKRPGLIAAPQAAHWVMVDVVILGLIEQELLCCRRDAKGAIVRD
ncbi:hypothetical protein H0I39_12435 [Ottowia beijingensis]|uniref:Uncharacterized protein n=1 Tax=Ottowia beijingensis TaxID=1207057 RepID=A0A853IP23_9BURK|nr:hypothetical protein [Ottowia beijingensis]NZA02363.1 hypothetical protein [Ottowia beijingensis]HMN14805.1 hypothetical protein [Bellilinea sp.]